MVVSIQIVGVQRQCTVIIFQFGMATEAKADEVRKRPVGSLSHKNRNLMGAIVPELSQQKGAFVVGQMFEGFGNQGQVCHPVQEQVGIGVDGVQCVNVNALLMFLPDP